MPRYWPSSLQARADFRRVLGKLGHLRQILHEKRSQFNRHSKCQEPTHNVFVIGQAVMMRALHGNRILHTLGIERQLTVNFTTVHLATFALGSPWRNVSDTHGTKLETHTKASPSPPK